MANYLDFIGVAYCHVPNGGHRGNKIAAAKLKAQGTKRGVPDYLIFDPPPYHPNARGVAIELKRVRGGSVSKEQRQWLETLDDCGWMVKVCKGSGEAIDWLTELGF